MPRKFLRRDGPAHGGRRPRSKRKSLFGQHHRAGVENGTAPIRLLAEGEGGASRADPAGPDLYIFLFEVCRSTALFERVVQQPVFLPGFFPSASPSGRPWVERIRGAADQIDRRSFAGQDPRRQPIRPGSSVMRLRGKGMPSPCEASAAGDLISIRTNRSENHP